jgi:methionyl aminopeptidase
LSANIERTGAGFDPQRLLDVQRKTFAAVREIAATFRPGMLEDDAYEFAKRRLLELGFAKNWHRPYVRFGANTTLIYGMPSVPGTRLGENDLFFLDVGTVMDGYEGDAGETFVVGREPRYSKCAEDSRRLWREVRDAWSERKLTGPALYGFARDGAERLGWALNPDWAGHRISDFPHHAYYKGSLAEAELCPAPGIWVLEIHLCDPKGAFGAFHEDLLT